MYCENCGKKISDKAKFCKYCGTKVGEISGEKEVQEERKKPWATWQPVNIILGILVLLSVPLNLFRLYFHILLLPVLFIFAVVSAFIIIRTQKNNFLSGLFLLIIGLVQNFLISTNSPALWYILGSPDFAGQGLGLTLIIYFGNCLILISGIYMLCSAVFLMVKKEPFILQSLAIAFLLILGWNAISSMNAPRFVQESQLEISEALDPNIRVYMTGETQAGPASFKTSFFSGEPFFPMEEGLAAGTEYGFRVVYPNASAAVPLKMTDRIRVGRGTEGSGMFNSKQDTLLDGNYTLELVKVEKNKGLIVGRTNFSIIPVDVSQLKFWLTLKESSERNSTILLESFDSVDMHVWVQGPSGSKISGVLQVKKLDGTIRWQENFETSPSGEPVRIFNMSGTPDNYNLELLVAGRVVANATIEIKNTNRGGQ